MTLPNVILKICPMCGLPLQAHSIFCTNCGSSYAISVVKTRLQFKLKRIVAIFWEDPDSRFRIFVWILALVPFLVAPPILALIISIFGNKKQNKRVDLTMAAVVASANVIISVIVIMKTSHSFTDIVIYYFDSLRWWLSPLTPDQPDHRPGKDFLPV